MNIKQARALKLGQRISCPPDRGDQGYVGTVTYIGPEEHTNILGVKYRDVVVQDLNGKRKSCWPSHRIT